MQIRSGFHECKENRKLNGTDQQIKENSYFKVDLQPFVHTFQVWQEH